MDSFSIQDSTKLSFSSKSVTCCASIPEAMLLCIIGGLIGVIIGSLIYFSIASYQEWPIAMSLSAILGSVTFSAMVGLFFGIWPARRAAKLDPAVALLYE